MFQTINADGLYCRVRRVQNAWDVDEIPKMSLTFFLDEPNTRAALATFAQGATDVMLVSNEGTRPWGGELPTRVGDYFYNSRIETAIAIRAARGAGSP